MSGRLMKRAFELEEFKVLCRLRAAIKGQALADFLIEFTYLEEPVEQPPQPDLPPELQGSIPTWVLHIDESSTRQGSGADVILITPNGVQMECA